jgi:hypothetical protein
VAPSVAWDEFGNLFLAYCGWDKGKLTVVVGESTDGGQNFTRLPLSINHLATFRPRIIVSAGSVWVAYSSEDPGPKPLSPHEPQRPKEGPVEAAGARVFGPGVVGAFSTPEDVQPTGWEGGRVDDVAVGPAGQVIVTFYTDQMWPHIDLHGTGTVYTALDPDGLGPAGFNAPQVAVVTQVDSYHPILQGFQNAAAGPGGRLAWDRSPGPHHGRLYLVYTDAPAPGSSQTDIFVKYSDDNGTTWSLPVRASDDAGTNSRFLPAIAVDQSNGWVAVAWYDARYDLGFPSADDTDGIANDEAEIFATASVDAQGLNFLPNVQVAAAPSHPLPLKTFDMWYSTLGSGMGLAFAGGTFYPAWADNSPALSKNPDLPNFDIATAAVSAPWTNSQSQSPSAPSWPSNPDPLSVILPTKVYVLLHAPDPAPIGPGFFALAAAPTGTQAAAVGPLVWGENPTGGLRLAGPWPTLAGGGNGNGNDRVIIAILQPPDPQPTSQKRTSKVSITRGNVHLHVATPLDKLLQPFLFVIDTTLPAGTRTSLDTLPVGPRTSGHTLPVGLRKSMATTDNGGNDEVWMNLGKGNDLVRVELGGTSGDGTHELIGLL